MSIEIQNETKTVEILKEERTWRCELETPKGGNYSVKIHREIAVSEDGAFSHTEECETKSFTEDMMAIVGMEGTVSYKDKTGADKTIPLCDIPFLMPEAIEILVAKKKAEASEGEEE